MELSVKPQLIKSKKTGKEYNAYVLTIGDYTKLFFPVGNMESRYLERVVANGIEAVIGDGDDE